MCARVLPILPPAQALNAIGRVDAATPFHTRQSDEPQAKNCAISSNLIMSGMIWRRQFTDESLSGIETYVWLVNQTTVLVTRLLPTAFIGSANRLLNSI